ncbi:MAG: hypothetical protein IPO06_24490 [Leptospiraceae bacterium]|nr:hypothetical protein [Leptospiraceae bacterium]
MTGVTDANIISETVTITASGVDLGRATTNHQHSRINTMSIILTGNRTTALTKVGLLRLTLS